MTGPGALGSSMSSTAAIGITSRTLEAMNASSAPRTSSSVHTASCAPHSSITRQRVMEESGAEEAVCTLDDVRAAEEAFIASSVREVLPIAAVDDIELPSAPGPVTQDARESLARRIERELGAPA